MDRPWTAITGVYVLAFADFGAVRAPSEAPPAIRVLGNKIDACKAERLTRHISLLQRSENESHGLSAPSTMAREVRQSSFDVRGFLRAFTQTGVYLVTTNRDN